MTKDQENFIKLIGTAARKYYDKYGVLPSLVIAMAIKESNWGKSQLSAKYHNYFGMKWNTKCGTKYVELPTKEYKNGQYITVKAKFRAYDSMEEGIKGFYDFITGYKRYSNLIGELDPEKACILIQKDGWATAPNYGTSLYNDYVVKYDLTAYNIPGNDIYVPDPVIKEYKEGEVYTTNVDLYIRNNPYGRKKKMYDLTVSGKLHSYPDPYGDAILKSGTRVTCKGIEKDGKSVWMIIPSGYICAVTGSGKVYIE